MKRAGLLMLAALLASGVVAPRALAQESRSKSPKNIAAVDINRATADDFDKLPGIGPELARRIVAYREKHGPFRRIEDLMAVRGMGPKKWRALKPYLRVEGDHSRPSS